MELQIALIFSALLQVVAFIITISLITKTRFNVAWISISIGFLLMALRRIIEVIYFFRETSTNNIPEINSWIAIIISVAMLVSSIYIRKIFEVINRIHQLRKENEAKLLSAVISAEERERKNFSKELHDGLGPVLSSAKMTISAINKKDTPKQTSELLEKIESLVDNAIISTREISNHLTPHVLERYGLKKAIEIFIRNTSIKETINIELSTNIEKKRFKYNIEVILYRIFCELVNNTLKYANATNIDIIIQENKKMLELNYKDNGIGFDIEREEYSGMGLTNIKSRVTSLNGFIEMDSTPLKGFHINIKLPK